MIRLVNPANAYVEKLDVGISLVHLQRLNMLVTNYIERCTRLSAKSDDIPQQSLQSACVKVFDMWDSTTAKDITDQYLSTLKVAFVLQESLTVLKNATPAQVASSVVIAVKLVVLNSEQQVPLAEFRHIAVKILSDCAERAVEGETIKTMSFFSASVLELNRILNDFETMCNSTFH